MWLAPFEAGVDIGDVTFWQFGFAGSPAEEPLAYISMHGFVIELEDTDDSVDGGGFRLAFAGRHYYVGGGIGLANLKRGEETVRQSGSGSVFIGTNLVEESRNLHCGLSAEVGLFFARPGGIDLHSWSLLLGVYLHL